MSKEIEGIDLRIKSLQQEKESLIAAEEERQEAMRSWEPTQQNIRAFLCESDNDVYELLHGGESSSDEWHLTTSAINYKYHMLLLEHHSGGGGSDDYGSDYWSILALVRTGSGNHVSYWRVPGWYGSCDGTEVEPENTFEVTFTEITIKKWSAV